jgi:hypothetical protein
LIATLNWWLLPEHYGATGSLDRIVLQTLRNPDLYCNSHLHQQPRQRPGRFLARSQTIDHYIEVPLR